MVKGMLQLLSNCPPETAHLRKELLIAAKHILTTDLRSRKFPSPYAMLHRDALLRCAQTFSTVFIDAPQMAYAEDLKPWLDVTWGKYSSQCKCFEMSILLSY